MIDGTGRCAAGAEFFANGVDRRTGGGDGVRDRTGDFMLRARIQLSVFAVGSHRTARERPAHSQTFIRHPVDEFASCARERPRGAPMFVVAREHGEVGVVLQRRRTDLLRDTPLHNSV